MGHGTVIMGRSSVGVGRSTVHMGHGTVDMDCDSLDIVQCTRCSFGMLNICIYLTRNYIISYIFSHVLIYHFI